MKFFKAHAVALTAVVLTSALALIALSGPTTAATTRQLSSVFDTTKPWNVIAVLPEVGSFMNKLRSGKAMRAFFDSPLGLHFLKSAPTRGAAHLHRLVSLVPGSWQWNLYSLITDGPVFYRSHAGKFALVIALTKKGKLITSVLPESSAARTGDWLVIASDKATLKEQLEYLKAPKPAASALDAAFSQPGALSLAMQSQVQKTARRGLTRTLLHQGLGLEEDSMCRLTLQPEGEAIGIEGECTPYRKNEPPAAGETLVMKDFPAFAWYRTAPAAAAHLFALGGLETDYGYLIPRLFYTGPITDQKSLDFLSQAFKTRNHILEPQENAIQIRYPYPYRYAERKFDLFAPHLATNRRRFFWNSYLANDKIPDKSIELRPEYSFYLDARLYPLIKRSEAAVKQFDALYSPGHFHEFRDALFKSLPALKNASMRLFAKPQKTTLRLGGVISFADT